MWWIMIPAFVAGVIFGAFLLALLMAHRDD
jgi:hypothetical protein